MKFKQRSYQKELIDGNPSFADLKVNLDELHTINKFLGGYSISLNALEKVKLKQDIHLLDIGSGGGHLVKYLYLRMSNARSNNSFQGLDIKPDCIQYAEELCKDENISFHLADYKKSIDIENINVIHACLFFHHLPEDEIISFIKSCINSNKTLIINDLERNPLAYYSIKLLSKLFSNSHLVKHDAPLSVLRGFKRKEWQAILTQAAAKDYSIKNKWAFRHQIIIYG